MKLEVSKLSSIILYHRKKSSLSRIDLARLAGVGKTVIYDVEHGKLTIQLTTLVKILEALNITMQLDSPFMKEALNEKS